MGFMLLLYIASWKKKRTDAGILKFQFNLDLKALVVTMHNLLEIKSMLLNVSV